MSPEDYKITVTGKYNLCTYSFECPKCKKAEERTLDMREHPEGWDVEKNHTEKCADCDVRMRKVYMTRAPTIFIGGDDSDRRIALMRKSFRQRFTKGPEIDDVRHTKGKLFDDSLRSAAASRIKSEEADK